MVQSEEVDEDWNQAALEDDAERYNELKFNIYISRKNNYIC